MGTFHFGDQTVASFSLLMSQSTRGQQVNSVFGEGVNPRLRKIRDGLDTLGLPADEILNHGGPRLVYGVELTRNSRAYLLGLDRHPRYVLVRKNPQQMTRQIAEWWIKRWMLGRIEKKDVVERVARHNFIHPIRHGARVPLPNPDLEQGTELRR